MFKTWEELSELEQLQSIYSDMYKDAHGFRPRGMTEGWSVDDYKFAMIGLQETIKRQIEEEKQEANEAVVRFEARIAEAIAHGARERIAALRWIMEADEANGDPELLCYLNDLPFDYLDKAE